MPILPESTLVLEATDCFGLEGDCTKLVGDCSGLIGDCTGLRGDCTGLRGNLNEADLTPNDRQKGVDIKSLIKTTEGGEE